MKSEPGGMARDSSHGSLGGQCVPRNSARYAVAIQRSAVDASLFVCAQSVRHVVAQMVLCVRCVRAVRTQRRAECVNH